MRLNSRWGVRSLRSRLLSCVVGVVVALLGTANADHAFNLDYMTSSDYPEQGHGEGILLFAYGTDESTMKHFMDEAFTSARRIKELNPSVNISLVTNPDYHPDITGAFDMIINVRPEHLLDGRVPNWKPNGFQSQWLTRLEYLGRSPYEVTLALDSQALCCATTVDQVLKEGLGDFDIAYAVQGPKVLQPHNWAIMYRLNERTKRMFHRWRILHIAKSKNGSDQGTLYMAAGSLALQDRLKVGVLSEYVALALVPYSRSTPPYPKSSRLIDPGMVHFVHFNARKEEQNDACEILNHGAGKPRVMLALRPEPRKDGVRQGINWKMMYSENELKDTVNGAREGAGYFKGMDWENKENKWGEPVTPWRTQYPDCWEHLLQDVDTALRQLLSDSHLRAKPVISKEFSDDAFWPKEAHA